MMGEFVHWGAVGDSAWLQDAGEEQGTGYECLG